MVELPHQVSSVAQVIQLAVAPVFLLAGIGSLLGVLTNRLARIIDRFHVLEQRESAHTAVGNPGSDLALMISLSHRARLIHAAIILCTVCELLVCVVVAALFVGSELHIELSSPIAILFIAAMFSLIGGLGCFLREIALATSVIEGLYSSAASSKGNS